MRANRRGLGGDGPASTSITVPNASSDIEKESDPGVAGNLTLDAISSLREAVEAGAENDVTSAE
jgi:hypothetical protein